MLHWFRFHASVLPPQPARATYRIRPSGRGHPEECPPLRAACCYGFDVCATFAMTFLRNDTEGGWKLEAPVELEADWAWAPEGHAPAAPQIQVNAWFWERGQQVPHVISDDAFPLLRDQVKLSTWLYLRTDPDELLCITDIPNHFRPWRAYTALVDADAYPASYPWHCVLELDRRMERIHIAAGEPICRIFTVPRAAFVAQEMSGEEFGAFFEAGQEWLAEHGKTTQEDLTDITGAYARLMRPAKFSVRRTT